MKFLLPITALMLAACATPAGEVAARALRPADLNGTWDVALFFSSSEPPSATEMVLNAAEDGALSGSFYGSPFEEAEYSLIGDTLAFGSVTSDGAAPYSHSGRLVGGKIEGQTLSHGRDFLMTWVATRRADAVPAE
jgi:hypothetical protein